MYVSVFYALFIVVQTFFSICEKLINSKYILNYIKLCAHSLGIFKGLLSTILMTYHRVCN
jgi:hypothetical protein